MSNQYGNSGLFTASEFKNRGVIKLAPDVLIYLNGSLGAAVVTPIQGKNNVQFQDGITSVNVSNIVDPPGSSQATFEVTTPIYGKDSNYWVTVDSENTNVRVPYFTPMMEVNIYMKGRFLVNGSPKYYPSFWGIITGVEENFSGGSWNITVNCADMLHWWSYSNLNIHPIPETDYMTQGSTYLTAYSTIFDNANPFSIIYSLTKDMGMHQFVTPSWLAQLTPPSQIYPPESFVAVSKSIMVYWALRWQNIGSLLKMYGAAGTEIIASGPPAVGGKRPTLRLLRPLVQSENATVDPVSGQKSMISTRNKEGFEVDEKFMQNFTPFFDFSKMGTFTDAEYMSKLDIATEIKTRIDFEFFQDVNGQFIFKPPYYNMDVKNILPYHIKPVDVINASFGVDSEGIITVLEVQGPMADQQYAATTAKSIGFHMDMDLAKKYGIRKHKINMDYLPPGNSNAARSMAMGQMSFVNAKTTTGSLTIPGRPEMRLGYPVYVEHKDAYYYVKSINHSFDYGGSFSTTLSLEAERSKQYTTKGEEWVLQKDMMYQFKAGANIKKKKNETDEDRAKVFGDKQAKILKETGRLGSMDQGRYELVSRGGDPAFKAVTGSTIPFTDEEGYKVIGSFLYGRGLPISTVPSADAAEASRLLETKPKEKADSAITNMQTGSMKESFIMDSLFDIGPEGIKEEGIVPAYKESLNIKSDEAFVDVAKQLVGVKKSIGDTPKGNKLLSDILGPKNEQK